MQVKDVIRWNNRVSAMYALGVWTMICSYGYLRYTGRYDDTEADERPASDEGENPKQVVYETPHFKNTIVYKKDFVPYTTRMYSLLTTFTGGGAQATAKDAGKVSSDS